MEATVTAQAPVPQARVSPEPRSPDTHLNGVAVDHLNKLGVDPVRKQT